MDALLLVNVADKLLVHAVPQHGIPAEISYSLRHLDLTSPSEQFSDTPSSISYSTNLFITPLRCGGLIHS